MESYPPTFYSILKQHDFWVWRSVPPSGIGWVWMGRPWPHISTWSSCGKLYLTQNLTSRLATFGPLSRSLNLTNFFTTGVDLHWDFDSSLLLRTIPSDNHQGFGLFNCERAVINVSVFGLESRAHDWYNLKLLTTVSRPMLSPVFLLLWSVSSRTSISAAVTSSAGLRLSLLPATASFTRRIPWHSLDLGMLVPSLRRAVSSRLFLVRSRGLGITLVESWSVEWSWLWSLALAILEDSSRVSFIDHKIHLDSILDTGWLSQSYACRELFFLFYIFISFPDPDSNWHHLRRRAFKAVSWVESRLWYILD